MWPGNEISNTGLQLVSLQRKKRPHNGQVAYLIMHSYKASSVMSSFPKFGRGKKITPIAALDTRHCGNGMAVAVEELCVHVRGEGHRKK